MPKHLLSSVLIDLRDFAERSGLTDLADDLEMVRLRHLSSRPIRPSQVVRHQEGDSVIIDLNRSREVASPARQAPRSRSGG